MGDADTGYVLTEGEGQKTCLVREKGGNKAFTTACDSDTTPYTPLQLQFASAGDIKTMSSPGARMIGAASDGDKKAKYTAPVVTTSSIVVAVADQGNNSNNKNSLSQTTTKAAKEVGRLRNALST